MRYWKTTGLVSLAFAAAACQVRKLGGDSEVKAVRDIVSMQEDGTGTFNLVCKSGVTETGVTEEMISKGNVCLPTTEPRAQVNAKAFNAYNIWWDGEGKEILDYPANYEVTKGKMEPDGIFYVPSLGVYWENMSRFLLVPTSGIKVESDEVLVYPTRKGLQLKLKFTQPSGGSMFHMEAVAYCKSKGLRLPTAREIFDFCTAGVENLNYGPLFKPNSYPKKARCGFWHRWTVTMRADEPSDNFAWNGGQGVVSNYGRHNNDAEARCVGPV